MDDEILQIFEKKKKKKKAKKILHKLLKLPFQS